MEAGQSHTQPEVAQQQLEAVINQFNEESHRAITVPFPFFLDLYRAQEKQVVKLAERVE